MCFMKSLLTTSIIGTEMLTDKALTLIDTILSSGVTFSSLRDSAKPLLSLTNEKLFLQYCRGILVRNVSSLYLEVWHGDSLPWIPVKLTFFRS